MPSTGADQYRVVNLADENEVYFATTNQLYVQMTPGEKKDFQVQSVACGDCANAPNDAWGKPTYVTAVSIPPTPINVMMSDINIENFETADAVVSWATPDVGKWDQVKVEYSPNLPPAKTDTPYYISSFWGNSFTLEGLYQNTVYTVTVRFVSNNVEGKPIFKWITYLYLVKTQLLAKCIS